MRVYNGSIVFPANLLASVLTNNTGKYTTQYNSVKVSNYNTINKHNKLTLILLPLMTLGDEMRHWKHRRSGLCSCGIDLF